MRMRGALLLAVAGVVACESSLGLRTPLVAVHEASVVAEVFQLRVRWQPVPGAESYVVYLAREPGVSSAFFERMVPVTGQEAAVSGLVPLTDYFIAIEPIGGDGAPGPLSGELSAAPLDAGPISSVPAWTSRGSTGSSFGAAVRADTDVDLDGRVDVLVGAPTFLDTRGAVGSAYLFLGSGGALTLAPAWSAVCPKPGEFFFGNDCANGRFGATLAAVPSFGSSQFPDLLIAAPRLEPLGSGRIFAYHGEPDGAKEIPFNAIFAFDTRLAAGTAIGGLGDVTGDTYGDVIVGKPSPEATGHGGQVYAFEGTPAGIYGAPFFSLLSVEEGDRLGEALAVRGDVDGDQAMDVAIGAPGHQSGAGQVLLYESSNGSFAQVTYTLKGAAGDELGATLAFADVNDDGFDDLLVGSPGHDAAGPGEVLVDAGRIELYLGSLDGLATTPSWSVNGLQAGNRLSIFAIDGDLDFDGFPDLLVGTPGFQGIFVDEGRADLYIANGTTGFADQPAWTDTGRQPGALFGASVGGPIELDGDRYPDVLVGAPGFDGVGTATLFRGQAPTGPVAQAGAPAKGKVNVPFSPSFPGFSDEQGDKPYLCIWTWGDGTPDSRIERCDPSGTGAVSHRYQQPGTYVLKLRVTRQSDQVHGESITRVDIE